MEEGGARGVMRGKAKAAVSRGSFFFSRFLRRMWWRAPKTCESFVEFGHFGAMLCVCRGGGAFVRAVARGALVVDLQFLLGRGWNTPSRKER